MAVSDEIRVAPNIYRTAYGWRVYVRRRNPATGRSEKKPKRFGPEYALEELEHFRDSYKLESKRLRRGAASPPASRGGFTADARAYLELRQVRAMPSYKDRTREIEKWIAIFRDRLRRSITTREIDDELQKMRDAGAAGSSVNKYRTALMSLFTRLDGRAAANPVRDTKVFEETRASARGQPYALLFRILDAIDPKRSRPVKGVKGSGTRGSASRARLELVAFTGMDPVQVKRLELRHFSVRDRWYIAPERLKGKRRQRHPRPLVRKPMSGEAVGAFRRFARLKCYGWFDTRALRHTWLRACRKVERQLRKERHDPNFRLPHIRLKDLRHSFGTELFRQTKDIRLVGDYLDISYETAKRYALGAVPDVLRAGIRRFDAVVRRPARRARGTSLGGTTSRLSR